MSDPAQQIDPEAQGAEEEQEELSDEESMRATRSAISSTGGRCQTFTGTEPSDRRA